MNIIPKFIFVVMIAAGSTADAANIEHFTASRFAEQNTTTAGWATVTGTPGLNTVASTNGWVDSTNLTVGDSYLIMVWGYHNGNVNTNRTGFRVTHGGTAFTESTGVEEDDQTNAAYLTPYFWFTVWTAVSGEDIEVQYYNDSTNTSRVEDVNLVILNATDLGSSLQYVIQTGGGTLTTTFAAKATLTWTPANNGDTWWIMGYSRADINTITGDAYSARLTIDGTSLTAHSFDGEDANDTPIYGLGWAQTFTNTSKTITVDIRETNGNEDWLAAGVFALRLNFFDDFEINATAASQAIPLGGPPGAYQQLASITKTTTGAGSQWLIPSGFLNDDNNGRVVAHMQLDNVDLTALDGGWQPATTDVVAWTGVAVQNWSDYASHTIDLDARTTNNIASAGLHRWMAMIRLGPTRNRRVMTAD